MAEVENELLALELTQLRVSGDEAGGKPNPASSILKLRGSQLQQAVTELLVEVADRTHCRSRPRTRWTPRTGRSMPHRDT